VVFRSLRLDRLWNPNPAKPKPDRVVIGIHGEASEVDAEGYPGWMVVTFQMPARDELPPVKVTVYTGGKQPPEQVMRGDAMTKWGALLDGPKGAIFSDCPWNTRYALLPKKEFEGFEGPEKTLPRGPGHHGEWIEACKGRGEPFSSFEIGGPLTEFIQLANASILVGEPFEYDALSGQILNNPEANQYLHREYRDGWTL